MALTFAANSSNTVSHTATSAIDNLITYTIIVWGYLENLPSASASTVCTIAAKRANASNAKIFRVNAGDDLSVFINRTTTNLITSADLATGFSTAYGADEWLFMAATIDTGGANGDQKVFCGNLSNAVAEATTYSTQQVGSGTISSESGNALTVGRDDFDVTSWDGTIALQGVWDRQLSLGELRQQQFAPHPTAGCVSMCFYGLDGTGTQQDVTGRGHNGTVTGATLSSRSPGFLAPWDVVTGAPGGAIVPVSNDRLADMVWSPGRLPWMFGKLPIPDGTIS